MSKFIIFTDPGLQSKKVAYDGSEHFMQVVQRVGGSYTTACHRAFLGTPKA